MSINVACSCGHLFKMPDSFAGRELKCASCGELVLVLGTEETDVGDESDVTFVDEGTPTDAVRDNTWEPRSAHVDAGANQAMEIPRLWSFMWPALSVDEIDEIQESKYRISRGLLAVSAVIIAVVTRVVTVGFLVASVAVFFITASVNGIEYLFLIYPVYGVIYAVILSFLLVIRASLDVLRSVLDCADELRLIRFSLRTETRSAADIVGGDRSDTLDA